MSPKNKLAEEAMVPQADTVIDPWAVMVEPQNAAATQHAVPSSVWLQHPTVATAPSVSIMAPSLPRFLLHTVWGTRYVPSPLARDAAGVGTHCAEVSPQHQDDADAEPNTDYHASHVSVHGSTPEVSERNFRDVVCQGDYQAHLGIAFCNLGWSNN